MITLSLAAAAQSCLQRQVPPPTLSPTSSAVNEALRGHNHKALSAFLQSLDLETSVGITRAIGEAFNGTMRPESSSPPALWGALSLSGMRLSLASTIYGFTSPASWSTLSGRSTHPRVLSDRR
jgi:hypothetical protein